MVVGPFFVVKWPRAPWTVGALLLAAAAWLAFWSPRPPLSEGESARPVIKRNEPVPEFVLYDGDGQEATAAAWAGRPFVLIFWASWCGECPRVVDAAADVFRRPAVGGGVDFALVNVAEFPAEAAAFARTLGWDLPLLFDPTGAAAVALDVGLIPAVIIVDEYGFVVDRLFGPIGADPLLARLKSLLPPPEDAALPPPALSDTMNTPEG